MSSKATVASLQAELAALRAEVVALQPKRAAAKAKVVAKPVKAIVVSKASKTTIAVKAMNPTTRTEAKAFWRKVVGLTDKIKAEYNAIYAENFAADWAAYKAVNGKTTKAQNRAYATQLRNEYRSFVKGFPIDCYE